MTAYRKGSTHYYELKAIECDGLGAVCSAYPLRGHDHNHRKNNLEVRFLLDVSKLLRHAEAVCC